MVDADRVPFAEMLADVYRFYRRSSDRGEISEFDIDVWWAAMRPYDLKAVRDALGRHALNPDAGHFRPMPSDVVKMLGGSTVDSALVAWTKFEKAMTGVGPARSVAFDDPLIHVVLDEMGGWAHLGSTTSKDWPFRQNEFVTRYRGYKMRSQLPDYAPRLIGTAEGENVARGFYRDEAGRRRLMDETVLVGDAGAARAVIAKGSDLPRLAFTPIAVANRAVVAALEAKS